jgi:hypothetical protein
MLVPGAIFRTKWWKQKGLCWFKNQGAFIWTQIFLDFFLSFIFLEPDAKTKTISKPR